jgi:hypothetical protein
LIGVNEPAVEKKLGPDTLNTVTVGIEGGIVELFASTSTELTALKSGRGECHSRRIIWKNSRGPLLNDATLVSFLLVDSEPPSKALGWTEKSEHAVKKSSALTPLDQGLHSNPSAFL